MPLSKTLKGKLAILAIEDAADDLDKSEDGEPIGEDCECPKCHYKGPKEDFE